MLCVFLVAGGSARAEERYSEWGGGDEKYDALVDRLHELIDAAEKSRAADPILLRDLRNAIAEHTAAAPKAEPAPTLPSQKLVHDDFGDGNFTRNPAWTVVEGRFTVDSGLGLRSVVAKVAPAAQQTTQQSRTELVTDVLGSLLGSKKKRRRSRRLASRSSPSALKYSFKRRSRTPSRWFSKLSRVKSTVGSQWTCSRGARVAPVTA